jgi:hypothetical protein
MKQTSLPQVRMLDAAQSFHSRRGRRNNDAMKIKCPDKNISAQNKME